MQSFSPQVRETRGDPRQAIDDELKQRVSELEAKLAQTGIKDQTTTALFGGFKQLIENSAKDWIKRKLKELNFSEPLAMFPKGDYKGLIYTKFSTPETVSDVVEAIKKGKYMYTVGMLIFCAKGTFQFRPKFRHLSS